MELAYVGLGNLGAHLAMSLRRAGHGLRVHDLERGNAAALEAAGAVWAESAAAAARGAEAVFTCLPSPSVSERVLDAILPAMDRGAVWVEMSTLGRDEILRLAGRAGAAGVRVIECPVTGGVHLARTGQITLLVGGDPALVDPWEPVLRLMGARLFRMGPLGSAAVIKVITNMLAFTHLVADGEALMLAARGGLDLRTAWEAIAASSGTSFVHETEGQLILNGSYDIAFSMDLALKDLGFAMQFGREFGVPLELASRVQAIFEEGRRVYGGQAQSTQIVKLLEDALDTPLRAEGFPARLA